MSKVAREIRLTPRQRQLARQALGLTDGRTASYRNHFVGGPGHPDHAEWMNMRRKGAADYRSATATKTRDDLFWLTLAGAMAALGPGERLDPEDFPNAPRPGG